MAQDRYENRDQGRDKERSADEPPFGNPFLLSIWMAARAGEVVRASLGEFSRLIGESVSAHPPDWATPNRVRLELPTMTLRDFSPAQDSTAVPALICAPYALHHASVADLAPGHSLVAELLRGGVSRLLLTEWRSATPDMRYFSIDTYLADLNAAIDDIGAPVDLLGLCQGGWMALVYAARFPQKVRRLVLVGAPVDVRAGESALTRLTQSTALSTYEELARWGDGRILGQRMLSLWAPQLTTQDAVEILQLADEMAADTRAGLLALFGNWHLWTVDLPGTYYLQVVDWLFKQNQLAEGGFTALGRPVDLKRIDHPLYLLAGAQDQTVNPLQLHALAGLVATSTAKIVQRTAPCGHLALFLGARSIAEEWRAIAEWLIAD